MKEDNYKTLLQEGDIPRITVTSFNNGVDNFYKEAPNITREYENFISVSFLGNAFYHPYKATTDMKVHTFKLRNKQLNRYIALFIITALKNNTKNSSYGYQLSSTDLPLKKVLLPVNSKGEPDYKFMEDYIKEREAILKNQYKANINSNISKLKEIEQHKEWKDFAITDIFIPNKGNQNNMSSLTEGDIPLVSAKKFDNGYKMFASKNDKDIYPANIITLNNDGDGGAGIAYYQPAKHLLDSHVTALIPKNKNLSKRTLL